MIIIPVKILKAHLTAIAAGVKAAGFDVVRVSLDGGSLVFTLQSGTTYTVPDAAGDGITSFVYSFRDFKKEVGHIKDGNVVLSEELHDNGRSQNLINTINGAKLWSDYEFHLMNTPPSAPFAEMLAIDLLALLAPVNAATMTSDESANSIFQTVHLDFDGATLSANAMDGKHYVRRNATLTLHRYGDTPHIFQVDRQTIAAWIEVLKVLVKTKRGDSIVSFAADEHWLSLLTADQYDAAWNTSSALVAGVLDFPPTSWISEEKLIGSSEKIGHFDFEDIGTLQAALKDLPAFDRPGYDGAGYEGEFLRLDEGSLGSHTNRDCPEPEAWQIHGGALTLTRPDLYQCPKLYVQRDQLGHLLAGMSGAVTIEILERKIVSTWDKSVTIAYMIRVVGNRAVGMMTCSNRSGV